MIELDKEKEELAKARAVSNRVTNLGFGDAIRKRVAQYADVRGEFLEVEPFALQHLAVQLEKPRRQVAALAEDGRHVVLAYA